MAHILHVAAQSLRAVACVTTPLTLLALVGLAPGCDSHESCAAIAARYQVALPEALACSAEDPDACTVGRPLVVSEQREDGSLVAEGLCRPPCTAAVTPTRTSRLDTIRDEYDSAGCRYLSCFCPIDVPPGCESGVCYGLID